MVKCTKCDATIDVEEEDLDEGDELTCEECGATLRVASLGPLELESAEEEEDEDDEDDDDLEDDDEDEEDEDWK